ncbi:hypothetical protein C1886_11330 [Pseudomonas sp. FW300-N1A1]|nr:hypothetical protein C1886_11330 [Pseudomonas sp. FW300-N1A1]
MRFRGRQQSCSHGLWRASLLALGCTAAPKPVAGFYLNACNSLVGGASHPSASKLARHRVGFMSAMRYSNRHP